MIQFAKRLCSLHGEKYQHSYISKITYERQSVIEPVGFKITIVKDAKRFQLIEICGLDVAQHVVAVVQVLLFLQVEKKNAVAKIANLSEGFIKWRLFTREEIEAFSLEVGDRNIIHLVENPVVQGMLLLNSLYTWLARPLRRLEIKFVAPVYAGEMIYLEVTAARVCGYCENREVFVAKLIEGDEAF